MMQVNAATSLSRAVAAPATSGPCCPASLAATHSHGGPHQRSPPPPGAATPSIGIPALTGRPAGSALAVGPVRCPARFHLGTVARSLHPGTHHYYPVAVCGGACGLWNGRFTCSGTGTARAVAPAGGEAVADGADDSAFLAATGPGGFLEAPTAAEVRMSTASERAAATSAVGPAAAARMQADCIRAVRAWCKLGYGDHIVVHVEHQQLASTSAPGLLTSAAAIFSGPDGRRHAAIAIAVGVRCDSATSAAAAATPAAASAGLHQRGVAAAASPPSSPGRSPPPLAAPGSAAPVLDPLPGLSLHWGCCHGPGQRWHGPAPGWHTRPAVSYDAGRGAWQTPLALRPAIPLEEEQELLLSSLGSSLDGPQQLGGAGPWVAAYSLLLQVPWEGAVRNGGICFVLKTARDQWIKARANPGPAGPDGGSSGRGSGRGTGRGHGAGGGGEADFWLVTSGLPLVAHGAVLLPDVFRMSVSDSLPQVAQPQPLPELDALENGNGNGHANGHVVSNGHASGHGGGAAALTASPNVGPAPAPTPARAAEVPAQAPPATAASTTDAAGDSPAASPAAATSPNPTAATAPTTPAAAPAAAGSTTTADVGSAADSPVDLLGAAAAFRAPPRHSDVLLRPAERHPLPAPAPGGGACGWMVEQIAQREPGAERSLMHRYNTGTELVAMAAGSGEAEGALAAITAWLRLSSARLLVWNRNYNVKPREISAAQGRLAAALAGLGATRGSVGPSARGGAGVGLLVRVALAAVGRGGAGEVGQRIRDEILAIQHRNACKGGMMEEWHQKLHNNTSPDDVVICRALLDYIAAGLDITAYWRTLAAGGITAQRLASFDRPIVSEPRFSGQQAAGLQRDLTAYLQTLQAVHGGDDLRSAVSNVLGYEEADMKGKRIVVPPVPSVATPALSRHLRSLLALLQHLQQQQQPQPTQAAHRAGGQKAAAAQRAASAAATGATAAASGPARPTDVGSLVGLPGAVRLMEMLLEGRHMIKPALEGGEEACGGRLVDVMFLDLALDSALRTAVESNMSALRAAVADATAVHIAAAAVAEGPRASDGAAVSGIAAAVASAAAAAGGGRPLAGAHEASAAMTQVLEVLRLAVENAALSTAPNDDLVYSNKWLRLLAAQDDPRDARDRMLQALAICDRVKRSLADSAAATMGLLQPAADALAARLGLPADAVGGLGEEAVRGGAGAPLAQLLAVMEPPLRRATGGGAWQIVSRGTDRAVLAGRLRAEPRLAPLQHERMAEPTVLLVEGITGAEEIPEGCVAVLVGSAAEGGGSGGSGCPDVLSHSAVRARNMGVLLAGCYSPELVAKMRAHAGARVMIRLEGSQLQISFGSSGPGATAGVGGGGSGDGSGDGGDSGGSGGSERD